MRSPVQTSRHLSQRAMILAAGLLLFLPLVHSIPGNCRAGGAGYAYAFNGLEGTTISLQWQTEPLSQVTLEYWLNLLDTHMNDQPVFAYSAFSSTGRYGEGGEPYENANELAMWHARSFARLSRATSWSADFPEPSTYARSGSWVHVALVWSADPTAGPNGQSALYINGSLVGNETICAVGTCDMGLPVQPGGIIHLGLEADRAWGDFDEWQALTGVVDEIRVWQVARTDAQIAADFHRAVSDRTGLNIYWQFDDALDSSTHATDSSGNARHGLVGRLASVENLLTYITGKASQPPRRPTRLPSTAPVVGDGPVASLILEGSNLLTLGSADPEDDDLVTVITSTPAHGTLSDATGARLAAGMVVHDPERRQNKRVWYTPSVFSTWERDNFTYSVSDGGANASGSVELERYSLPVPEDSQMDVPEDTFGFQVLGKPYLLSQSKEVSNLKVRITSLPTRGTLYQACFDGSIEAYTAICTDPTHAERINSTGTVLRDSRGVVMFMPLENEHDPENYTTFRYQFVDPENETLASAEATVLVRVSSVNDAPVGIPISGIVPTGPTTITLAGVDVDQADGDDGSAGRQFVRVTAFPRIGRLFQTNKSSIGALMDGTRVYEATVVEWASEVLRFSSQYSKCSLCAIWSGAEATGCNQGFTSATSSCRGSECAVEYGRPLVWGDGTCSDSSWHATNILGANDFFPEFGDSPLGYDLSHENSGKEFIELKFPSELYITGFDLYETLKPGAVFRVSSAPSYDDDNTVACCGPDFPPSGQCEGYPVCSTSTNWQTLWSGTAQSKRERSRLFQPPLCPLRQKSQVIRLDLDTAAVPGWNNFDAARLIGTLDMPAGDVIPDEDGVSQVTYIPRTGVHGTDEFYFQVTDCLAYGAATPIRVTTPAPAGAFEAAPYLKLHGTRESGRAVVLANLDAPTDAGATTLYQTFRDLLAQEEAGAEVSVELKGVRGITYLSLRGQQLLQPGDAASLPLALWSPELEITVGGIGEGELWFTLRSLTFRMQLEITTTVPVLNLGVLLPMFGTLEAGYGKETWSPRAGVYQAVREINNKTDGVADDLLLNTRLRIAYRDSKCDSALSLQAALHLTRDAFDGDGVRAIIGAGCSGASVPAEQVAAIGHVPIISPSSTSPALSDGKGHPYFLRTIPSDAFNAVAMVSILTQLWNYTSVALAHSNEAYGAGMADSFATLAFDAGVAIRTTQTFTKDATDFSAQHQALLRSESRVIVLLAQASDTSRFMRKALDVGVGGEGYLWLLADAAADSGLWERDEVLVADPALRLRVLRGAFALVANAQRPGVERYDAYLARRRRMRSTLETADGCDLELDDDGTLLWAQDHDGNASTPLACAGFDPARDGTYDAFGYDAVFAVAYAVHDLIEVQNRSSIKGSEMLEALIERVHFEGVTGLVDFYDASADPDRLFNGDRRVGVSYFLLNYAGNAEGLVTVGSWTRCTSEGCSWLEQWAPTPGVTMTFSTTDNQKPPQTAAKRPSVVRLGILLPMFGTAQAGYSPISWSPRAGVYQAVREINNKSDGVGDHLLPHTQLRIAYRDSKCDSARTLQAALQLVQDTFDGEGVHAIVGAACSGASVTAAQVAEGSRLPIISPTSTSPALSNGRTFPYFLRTVPTDQFASYGMVSVMRTLWNYSHLALVHSTDAYGQGVGDAFIQQAESSGLTLLTVQKFAKDAVDFSVQQRALRASGARVVVLCCQASDGSRFLRTAYEEGIGGEGFLWLGGDTLADSGLWSSDTVMSVDKEVRERVLKGFFALAPNGQPRGSAQYEAYLARRRRLSPHVGSGASCDLELDDDGTLLWAQDHDGNASTPLACAGFDPANDLSHDAFGYDAVFAVAYAVHDLIEVQNRSSVEGSEVLEALIERVHFEGVTGLVDFYDASADPDRLFNGDRRVGVLYNLVNYAGNAEGLVTVGSWTRCTSEGCSWLEQWTPAPGVTMTFSTTDNQKPPQTAAKRPSVVHLGVLLPMFSTPEAGYSPISWSPRAGVYQAVREINNKSDGVGDDLLPHTQLRIAYRDSKCDSPSTLSAILQLTQDAFGGEGVHAIVGAACSEASVTAAQVAASSRVPIISPAAHSPTLSDGRKYPFFLRTVASDALSSEGVVDILRTLFDYSSCAVVSSADGYGAESARAFADAAVLAGFSVSVSVSFSQGTTDLSPQLLQLQRSKSRVIVLFAKGAIGAHFIRTAQAANVGGEGFLLIFGDPTILDEVHWSESGSEVIGSFVLSPDGGKGTPAHDAFRARRRLLPPLQSDVSEECSLETDDEGSHHLWGQHRNNDPSAPFLCADDDPEHETSYDAFGYDAVFALAYALHDILEVRNRTEIDGGEVLDTLISEVDFEGLTGRIDFYDASGDPARLFHGDRRRDVTYTLQNYLGGREGLVTVGTWTAFASDASSQDYLWNPVPGMKLTFSTADNSRPPERASCAFGEVLSNDGICVCDQGFEAEDDGVSCRPCEPGRSSSPGLGNTSSSSGCTFCAENYYGSVESPLRCTSCNTLEGVRCPANTTASTLALHRGFWRHSVTTLETWPCKSQGSWSPCRGGVDAGDEGTGYCEAEYYGPRCELCRREDYYFDAGAISCRPCTDVRLQAAIAFGTIAACVVVVFGTLAELSRSAWDEDRLVRRLRQSAGQFKSLWLRAGMQCKLKTIIGFAQCISAVPSVFNVRLPDALREFEELHEWLQLPYKIGLTFAIDSTCLGQYNVRLLLTSLWPFALILLILAICAVRQAWLMGYFYLRSVSAKEWCNRELAGQVLQEGGPVILVLTFALVPAISSRIFRTFLCVRFQYDDDLSQTRRYMQEDLAVSCDSDAYSSAFVMGLLLTLLWPVGVPLLYAGLLWANREAIITGKKTQQSAAIGFLHNDYEPYAFFWEPLEMARKIVLTGGVLLMPETMEQGRLLVCLLLSIFFLTVQMITKPLYRVEDEAVVTIVQVVLVLMYLSLMVLKSCTLDEEICASYGFGENGVGLFLFFLIFSLSTLVLLIALSIFVMNAARERRQFEHGDSDSMQNKDLLALFSNPKLRVSQARALGLRPLSFGQDIKHLLRAMSIHEIAIEPAATLQDAQAAISKYRPRILVFSGHTVMGSLAFEDTSGRLDEHASAESIGKMLYDGRQSLLNLHVRQTDASARSTSRPCSNLAVDSIVDEESINISSRESVEEHSELSRTPTSPNDLSPFSPKSVSRLHSSSLNKYSKPSLRLSRLLRGDRESGRKKVGRALRVSTRAAESPPLPPGSALLRLECIVLNGCKTESIGRHLLSVARHVTVVCWSTLAEDNAARAFSVGFYQAVHTMLQKERQGTSHLSPWRRARGSGDKLKIELAFNAGCTSFVKEGFTFGDPEEYFHPRGHPHDYRPDYTSCINCTPPVHGECLMLRIVDGEVCVTRATEVIGSRKQRDSFAGMRESLLGVRESFLGLRMPRLRSSVEIVRRRSRMGSQAALNV
ncbi:hypothetical protein AB1Y20_005647 [Prymnesium parvum]|uniref:Receptor ligand binding region domain-containing protein n=1 Tax=Prymnesium parvum TaxID=97485 RepID=A0AB34J4V2_PRYPA